MIPAIIIARGGSKRLPRKNVLPFCGLPLVAWSIIQAKCSKLIDGVWLSTDDDEIAEIGKKYGAQIIWRTDDIAGDISAGPVFKHAIEILLKKYDFDTVCNLIPTTVCRKPNDIDRAVKAFDNNKENINEIVALHCPKEIIVWEKVTWRKDGEFCFPIVWNKNHRYFIGDSIVGILYVDHFLKTRRKESARFEKDSSIDLHYEICGHPKANIGYIETDWYQQYDIDYKDDFELCELLMERYILKGRGAEIYKEYKEQKNEKSN